jgi:hypothetical protein
VVGIMEFLEEPDAMIDPSVNNILDKSPELRGRRGSRGIAKKCHQAAALTILIN